MDSPDLKTRSILHRFADWFDDDGIDLSLLILPILIGLAQILLTGDVLELIAKAGGDKAIWRWIAEVFLLVAIPVFILVAIAARRKTKRTTSLAIEVDGLRAEVLRLTGSLFGFADDLLKEWASVLGFGGWEDVSERVTIYAHDGTGSFTAFGRFSKNPQFRKKSKRSTYLEDQGCIARAWQRGWYFKNDYPDPICGVDEWVARCVQDGMIEDTARQMNMKSRLYCGYRVDSKTHDPMAVVIVESTDPSRYTELQLREFFDEFVVELREPLERFQAVLPRSGAARELGY